VWCKDDVLYDKVVRSDVISIVHMCTKRFTMLPNTIQMIHKYI